MFFWWLKPNSLGSFCMISKADLVPIKSFLLTTLAHVPEISLTFRNCVKRFVSARYRTYVVIYDSTYFCPGEYITLAVTFSVFPELEPPVSCRYLWRASELGRVFLMRLCLDWAQMEESTLRVCPFMAETGWRAAIIILLPHFHVRPQFEALKRPPPLTETPKRERRWWCAGGFV